MLDSQDSRNYYDNFSKINFERQNFTINSPNYEKNTNLIDKQQNENLIFKTSFIEKSKNFCCCSRRKSPKAKFFNKAKVILH